MLYTYAYNVFILIRLSVYTSVSVCVRERPRVYTDTYIYYVLFDKKKKPDNNKKKNVLMSSDRL